MVCNCNCSCNCPYKHTTTALSTAGLLTVTNATNIGNFDPFCLILTICPDSVITTAPVAYTVTINGAAIPILDRWGYPITTDVLCARKCYKGRYIESATPHVTLMNVISNEARGIAAAVAAAQAAEG